jgi:hypothetical protein
MEAEDSPLFSQQKVCRFDKILIDASFMIIGNKVNSLTFLLAHSGFIAKVNIVGYYIVWLFGCFFIFIFSGVRLSLLVLRPLLAYCTCPR